jgi:GGDEF domain-containing protein
VTTKKTNKTGKTTQTRKAASPAKGKAGRAKLTLLEKIEAMGLLETDAAERLAGRVEGIAGPTGLDRASAWDRELAGLLGKFEASGGDGGAKKTLTPLLAWQETLIGTPATRDGIRDAIAALKRVIPFHGATLFVRNPDSPQVEPLVSVGFEVNLVSRIRFLEGAGFSSWVATRKKPVLYASLHRNEAPGAEHVRSFMAVPLLVGGECLGVLNLGHREDSAYDPAALRRLMLAVGSLAAPVQRWIARTQIEARETRDRETGFATPAYFRSRLDEEVVRCRELGHSMSLLSLRLIELPGYAQQFGEEFRQRTRGDLARLVQDWVRPTELVGHAEGDTLLVLVPGAREDQATGRGGELAVGVQKHNFPRRKRLTLGYSVATYPADAETSQELLVAVDKGLREVSRPPLGGDGPAEPRVLPESSIATRIP